VGIYRNRFADVVESEAQLASELWSSGLTEAKRIETTNALVQAAIDMLHGWARTIEENAEDLSLTDMQWYVVASDQVKFAIMDLAHGEKVDSATNILFNAIRDNRKRN